MSESSGFCDYSSQVSNSQVDVWFLMPMVGLERESKTLGQDAADNDQLGRINGLTIDLPSIGLILSENVLCLKHEA